jgi:Zn-finger nucleic acid-binding protein
MLCPADQTQLVMTDRQGIEIDYCPKCRGVWLDRGELDKIIERASPEAAVRRSQPQPPPTAYPGDYGERGEAGEYGEYGERGERGHYGYGRPYRKRKSLLGEIFDF